MLLIWVGEDKHGLNITIAQVGEASNSKLRYKVPQRSSKRETTVKSAHSSMSASLTHQHRKHQKGKGEATICNYAIQTFLTLYTWENLILILTHLRSGCFFICLKLIRRENYRVLYDMWVIRITGWYMLIGTENVLVQNSNPVWNYRRFNPINAFMFITNNFNL